MKSEAKSLGQLNQLGQAPFFPFLLPFFVFLLLFVFSLVSCKNWEPLLRASYVRQKIYREKTDLLLAELHYPFSGNSNLDSLLREKILTKYRAFRDRLDQDSMELLDQGVAFVYRATFDALRSPDLRIISFVLYEIQEIQRPNTQTSTTAAEIFVYSLRLERAVDFFDVVQEPLLVFENLAASCLRQLEEFSGTGNFYSQGVQPDREHLKMLSFGKSGIQVSFPPGQVMAESQGVIHILVPWAEAIPNTPWQMGIVRSFRPPGYRSRARKKEAAS